MSNTNQTSAVAHAAKPFGAGTVRPGVGIRQRPCPVKANAVHAGVKDSGRIRLGAGVGVLPSAFR